VAGQTVNVTQSGVSTCKPSVSPLSNTVAASGGSTNFTVTAEATCGWTAGTNTSWLTITSGSSGSGNGTVVVSVPANTSPLSRTGALTIGGVVVNVKQNAGSCSYTVSPTSQTIAGSGDVASITVTAGSGCAWTAFTSASWIKITAGSGSGNGSVSYSVAANTSSSSRTASVLVGGKSVSVTQSAGQLNPPSNLTVTPTGN
jgi:hypothetical protein